MRQRQGGGARPARLVGAAALLVMAAVHLQQLVGNDYSSLKTIGPLFGLNAAGGLLIAVALVVWDSSLPELAGLLVAAGSIVGLLISEGNGLFGYIENGYGTAVVIALVAEGVAVLALGVALSVRRSDG